MKIETILVFVALMMIPFTVATPITDNSNISNVTSNKIAEDDPISCFNKGIDCIEKNLCTQSECIYTDEGAYLKWEW